MYALLLAMLAAVSPPQDGGYLYKTVLLRAAPGHLLDVIDLLKDRLPVYDAAGDERPFIIRHSQGDHWDLMLIFPIESMSVYHASEREERRSRAAAEAGLSEEAFLGRLQDLVAWREETFFVGSDFDASVRRELAATGYVHVEMFIALPGKKAELLREREMENDYLRRIERPQNLIFTKTLGGSWDAFTLGLYRDLKHYAESADTPPDRQEQAARAAGFEGADRIGTYLRTLIARHNDTLGSPVR
jgi:hypothetical protein